MTANMWLNVTAFVKVELEVRLEQPWNPKATAEEIYSQGAKDALDQVTALIRDKGRSIHISSAPIVKMVTSEKTG
jgi:hypothetical protein